MPRVSKTEHKPYHHGNLKNALVVAGREVLEANGRAGFDLRTVARKAGVSHAAPYRHFLDKSALMAAVVQIGFEELAAGMEGKLVEVSGASPAEKLRVIAVAYVRFASQNPWLLREMYSGQSAQNENAEAHAAAKSVYRLYRDVIESGQEQGVFAAGDASALAGVLWSLMHGMATLVIDGQVTPYARGERGIEQFVSFGIRALITGMEA